MNEPFYRYKTFMIETYGAPLYRVPIDLGLGCPHRKANGRGGCTFCPPDGSRAGTTQGCRTLEAQVRRGIAFARGRYGAEHFMAYIQAFTGTLAPADAQADTAARLLALHPFDALSIGTRPDCLPPPVLRFLADLRRRVELWIELGVQTVHDATLQRVNRGHDWACSRRAIRSLHRRGIRTAVHVILGLPGEGTRHFRKTAEALADLPIDAIKIHNLHVVRGTRLAETYVRRPFPVFDEEEYLDILIDFLRRLPARLPVIRLTTDTAAAELLAPRWRWSKGQFLNRLRERMRREGLRQGDLCVATPASGELLEPVTWSE